MLVLSGRGAPDADHFRREGIGDFELYDFEREGKRPDGTPVKVALVSRMLRDKGVLEAIAAIRLLRSRGLPIELLLAGPTDAQRIYPLLILFVFAYIGTEVLRRQTLREFPETGPPQVTA